MVRRRSPVRFRTLAQKKNPCKGIFCCQWRKQTALLSSGSNSRSLVALPQARPGRKFLMSVASLETWPSIPDIGSVLKKETSQDVSFCLVLCSLSLQFSKCPVVRSADTFLFRGCLDFKYLSGWTVVVLCHDQTQYLTLRHNGVFYILVAAVLVVL